MKIKLSLEQATAPVTLAIIEEEIAVEFGLSKVAISPVYPRASSPDGKSKAAPKTRASGVIMGRAVKGTVTPMEKITLELGKVTVRGEVFDVQTREIQKRSAWLLSFDMTDGTSSIRVSKFMKDERAGEIAGKVKKGMVLTVSGVLGYNRYDGDLTLEPQSITVSQKEVRCDTAPRPRVELHLHTKMSAMDALTDVKEVIDRAVQWNHPAIAITDHGVVQSFPDAMKAAGNKIKVLYGVEGYYINDVDNRQAVFGNCAAPLDTEIVVFDIETTGLSSLRDEITEIGAVIIQNGQELGRFQTYVNPGRPIPREITRLTGISDSDVKDAPSVREAVNDFLKFAGGRPLAAHNAEFDMGFIYEACLRHGIDFEPSYLDTLALARALLPELKSHKLNLVAAHLGLPEFNHHRASDDAVTAGLILTELMKSLREEGVTQLCEINGLLDSLRRDEALRSRFRPQHIIILAKNQTGIKNLYQLVTKSHLDYFKRNPIIPKSLILQYREGLILGSACEAGEVFGLITDYRSRMEQRRLASFYDYLEIQPVCNNRFLLSGDRPKAKSEEDLRDFNRRVVSLGEEIGVPVVATCDVHFLDPEQEIFRKILLTSKGFEDAERDLPLYFRTTEEMLEEFSYLGAEKAFEVVVENTNRIADLCENVRPLPPAKTLFAPKIENSAEDLKTIVASRLLELYGESPHEIIVRRVETELGDILARNYDVIYMSAQKLVADSIAHGYLVGSRGSVGSSFVAFLAGITEVNALPAHYRCETCKHADFESGCGYGCGADMPDRVCPICKAPYVKDGFDIPFETFLGLGGDKVARIDLNFSANIRQAPTVYDELFGRSTCSAGTSEQWLLECYGLSKNIGGPGEIGDTARIPLGPGMCRRQATSGLHPGGLVVIRGTWRHDLARPSTGEVGIRHRHDALRLPLHGGQPPEAGRAGT
jgi:DNA polymerase-3 subunit alpha (Gram-positive type)